MKNKIANSIFLFAVITCLIFPVKTNAQGSHTLFSKTLQKGMADDQVAGLQVLLGQFSNIYPEALVMGYFGPLTEKAVKRFQAVKGISAIGIVGPITRGKLNEFFTGIAAIGPAGPVGATGATGVTGQQGASGYGGSGAIGATDETGPTGSMGATGAVGAIDPPGPSFLSISTIDINRNNTFVMVSGGSFTAGHAYCVMVTAPGRTKMDKVDKFIISVAGVTSSKRRCFIRVQRYF